MGQYVTFSFQMQAIPHLSPPSFVCADAPEAASGGCEVETQESEGPAEPASWES